MKEKTLIIIKPDKIKHCAEIWSIIKNNGFDIDSAKKIKISTENADLLCSIQHNFTPLSDFIHSDDFMVAILEKENAVQDLLTLIGDRDPSKAVPGTLRSLFGDTTGYSMGLPENLIHGSDSIETAQLEIDLFYNELFGFYGSCICK